MSLFPLRRTASLSATVLLSVSLAACGGGDAGGAPDDASQDAFCEAFTADQGAEEGDDVSADQVHDYADDLAEVGTPSSIDGKAREGFEILVDTLGDIDDDQLDQLAEDGEPTRDLDEDDKAKVTAFYESDAVTDCLLGDQPDTQE